MAFSKDIVSDYRTEKGVYYTAALFWDMMYQKDTAKYVVSDEDKEVNGVMYPSLKRLYLEMEDITEYEFANKYLDTDEKRRSARAAYFAGAEACRRCWDAYQGATW